MESEVNDSLIEEDSNITNVTGREAATPEGIAITYGSLFVMALLPLFFGSLRSVGYHVDLRVLGSQDRAPYYPNLSLPSFLQTRGEEAGDRIAMKDAAMFPVYASGGLFGLYLFFKVELCGRGGVWRCLCLPCPPLSFYPRNMSI